MFTRRTRWFQTLALLCAIAIGGGADGRVASAQSARPLAPELIGETGGATTAFVAGSDVIYAAVGARVRALEPGERPAVLAESALLPGRSPDYRPGTRRWADHRPNLPVAGFAPSLTQPAFDVHVRGR